MGRPDAGECQQVCHNVASLNSGHLLRRPLNATAARPTPSPAGLAGLREPERAPPWPHGAAEPLVDGSPRRPCGRTGSMCLGRGSGRPPTGRALEDALAAPAAGLPAPARQAGAASAPIRTTRNSSTWRCTSRAGWLSRDEAVLALAQRARQLAAWRS